MVTYAKIKTDAVVMNPISNPSTPNTLFTDIDNSNAASITGDTTTSVIGNSVGNTKKMQAGLVIRAGKAVSKRSDGFIIEAESDGAGAQQPVGISLAPIALGEQGYVLLFGPNAKDVLVGLGFAPGDEIYIGENTGGYVNDITPFADNNDSIIKVGIADCAEGSASSTATDLILFPQVIARP